MGLTNEFERDLENQAMLKRPGRIDFRVLQNTADAGDGHPGIQKCFRNYLHEGGMEKDLELLGFSIKGTSVDINNAELQQISNIGSSVISTSEWEQISNIGSSVITTSIWSQIDNIEATTISVTQWGYVGEADQPVKIADSPTFSGLTINGNITITGTVDTVDVLDLKNDVDGFPNQLKSLETAEIQQLENIGSVTISLTQWGYLGELDQSVKQSASPTFVGLTLSANLVTSSTVDGVDVAGHDHSGANQGGTVDHVNLANKGTNAHSVIDTHLGSTSNPHSVSLEQARTQGNGVSGQIDMNQNKIVDLPNCTADNDVARKKYIDDTIKNYFPIGTILMYKGTGWVDNSTVPGWYICNAANEASYGTPDLTNKFIRSEASSGNVGGSDDAVNIAHGHSGSSVSAGGGHTHNLMTAICNEGTGSSKIVLDDGGNSVAGLVVGVGDHGHGLTIANSGVSGTGLNKPAYYSLIFVMRVS